MIRQPERSGRHALSGPHREVIMNKKEISDFYVNLLAGEGYRPQVDNDKNVTFKREGKVFILAIDEDDPMLFQLLYPIRNDLKDKWQQKLALAAANEVTATIKVLKVTVIEDTIFASIQMFVSPLEALAPVFERCVTTIQAGAVMFELNLALKLSEAKGN